MPEVSSSCVSAIDWDEDSGELRVTLSDGGNTYVYPNIPQRVYEAFLAAPSKGRFFNYTLEPQYGVRRR